MTINQSARRLMHLLTCLSLIWVTNVLAETPLERGTYLVQGIAACGNCHTAKGPNGDVPGMDLAGMSLKDGEGNLIYTFPNITPDKETGVGNWTDEQLAIAIRQGIRPDGKLMQGIMPFELYRGMSDSDVMAIVAYIRSVPAISNEIPGTSLDATLLTVDNAELLSIAEVSRTDPVAYGAYLAGPLGHCIECHTPGTHGEIDYAHNLGAGGRVFKGPWGESVASNLTPAGLSRWTDDELKSIISSGMRPGGQRLLPPMGFSYYANISEDDLDAIVVYLRSLPSL